MKRTWKNFKLDKNKVYMRIGQAVVYSSLYIATLVFSYLMFLSGTTYQEGKMEKNNFQQKQELERQKLIMVELPNLIRKIN